MRSISVVIPILDDAEQLAGLLPLLSPHDLEVVVVDGGSTDGSLAVAQSAGAVCIIADRGRGSQLRAGCAAASGELIWMLHADHRVGSANVATLRALDETFRWGRFGVALRSDQGLTPLAVRVVAKAMNARSRVTGICTGDQGLVVARHLLEASAGVPDQPLMEDIEVSKRLRRFGPPAVLTPSIVASARRWLGAGVARTVLRMWWLRLRYFFGAPASVLAEAYYGDR